MSTSQTTADVTAAGLSKIDQNINNTEEDKSHEARGHKANLSNPSMSPDGLRTERMYERNEMHEHMLTGPQTRVRLRKRSQQRS